jgi:hypothetical protein
MEESISETIKKTVLPSGPKSVVEPEKELRFTRAAQALVFYAAAVGCFAASMAVFILSTQDWGMGGPMLDGWLWLCVPGVILTYLFLRIGLRCTRHAYLILSPLGIEIFPFVKPEKNLQIIYWSEVEDAEFSSDLHQFILHFNENKQSGVVVSLHPIPAKQRHLLKEAVCGVMAKKKKTS